MSCLSDRVSHPRGSALRAFSISNPFPHPLLPHRPHRLLAATACNQDDYRPKTNGSFRSGHTHDPQPLARRIEVVDQVPAPIVVCLCLFARRATMQPALFWVKPQALRSTTDNCLATYAQ